MSFARSTPVRRHDSRSAQGHLETDHVVGDDPILDHRFGIRVEEPFDPAGIMEPDPSIEGDRPEAAIGGSDQQPGGARSAGELLDRLYRRSPKTLPTSRLDE